MHSVELDLLTAHPLEAGTGDKNVVQEGGRVVLLQVSLGVAAVGALDQVAVLKVKPPLPELEESPDASEVEPGEAKTISPVLEFTDLADAI